MEVDDDQKYKYTIGKLEKCSYRFLQQKAKTLHLPSNFKKIYLIQLIHTTYFGSPEQVRSIVEHVRHERLQQQSATRSSARKPTRPRNTLQAPEITSTNEGTLQSPAITMTPRRAVAHSQYSPNLRRSLIKPDIHDPTLLGKRSPFLAKNTHNGAKKSYCNASQPGCVDTISYIAVPNTSYKIPKTTPYNPNRTLNPYRRSTNAPVEYSNVAQKKPETDRVLRNRSYPAANQHRPEKYKDSVKNSPPRRYSDVVNLRQRRANPVSNQLRLLRQTEECRDQRSVTCQTASFANETTRLAPRCVESARGNRNLEDKFDSVRNMRSMAVVPCNMEISQPPSPAKKLRRPSGIYPIESVDQEQKISYQFIQSGLGIRSPNGTYSKINVFVRKPVQRAISGPNNTTSLVTYKNPKQSEVTYEITNGNEGKESEVQTFEFNTQDVIAKTVSNAFKTQDNVVCSMNTVTHTQTSTAIQNLSTSQTYNLLEGEVPSAFGSEELTYEDEFTTYCHKKIRSEQVRSRRESVISRKETQRDDQLLPRIHEVFSSFNNVAVHRMTEPIVVQVCNESGKHVCPPQESARQPVGQNVTMLESLHNFRAEFLTNAPLPAIATTSNTSCVYSTPVLTTPMAQVSKFAPNAQVNMSNLQKDEEMASDYPNNMSNYLSNSMDHSLSSNSSLDMLASQVCTLTSNSTVSVVAAESIPDMVEDALELISQDGDYMERIELDEKAQCVLCAWTGPRVLLEHHIRQDHASEIIHARDGSYRVPLPLVALRRVASRVLLPHCAPGLLVLRAALAGDRLAASLATLSYDEDCCEVGTLTVYNEVTGEPFTWTGLIPPFSTDETPEQTLRVELSKLDLDSRQPLDPVSFHVRL